MRSRCGAAYPGRFAVIKPVDTTDPAIGEVVADWKKTEGTVGIRIMLRDTPSPTRPIPDRTGPSPRRRSTDCR